MSKSFWVVVAMWAIAFVGTPIAIALHSANAAIPAAPPHADTSHPKAVQHCAEHVAGISIGVTPEGRRCALVVFDDGVTTNPFCE